jgi:hypothetical protein
VLLAFQLVLSEGPQWQFTQKSLRGKGISQASQTLALLSFLGLIRTGGQLSDEVFRQRRSPRQFTRLIRQRVEKATGLHKVRRFWTREFDDAAVAKLLPANTAGDNGVRQALGCLRALHELVSHECDRKWLDDEILHGRRAAADVEETATAPSPVATATITDDPIGLSPAPSNGYPAAAAKVADSTLQDPPIDSGNGKLAVEIADISIHIPHERLAARGEISVGGIHITWAPRGPA